MAAASVPLIRRLVYISCFAADRPTRSGRRTDIPQMGARPHWPWVSPNIVDPAATSTSHASASSSPPVKQCPWSRAMTGWGSCSRASTVSGSKCLLGACSPVAMASRS